MQLNRPRNALSEDERLSIDWMLDHIFRIIESSSYEDEERRINSQGERYQPEREHFSGGTAQYQCA